MTTEHVSVPRTVEDVRNWHLHQLRTLKEAWQPYEHHKACAAILSRATPSDERCTTCDGNGDVHRADGEWLGECTACDANKTSAPRVVTEPLSVFSGGMWTWNETGQSFTKAEMDEAAFIVYRDHAESFANSLPAAMVPDGWKLVPLVPTAEMEDAAFDTFEIDDAKTQGFNSGTEARNAIYKAMLAAAPQAGERG